MIYIRIFYKNSVFCVGLCEREGGRGEGGGGGGASKNGLGASKFQTHWPPKMLTFSPALEECSQSEPPFSNPPDAKQKAF